MRKSRYKLRQSGENDMKVVIDINIWISYLMGSLLERIDETILSKDIKVVVSEEMLKQEVKV